MFPVAPPIGVNVAPPSVETSHCTVGAGLPVASAVKLTVPPASVIAFTGCSVTLGTPITVSVATEVVTLPPRLVHTAR